jgi:hypoxanthine phosphoribosyltransferase
MPVELVPEGISFNDPSKTTPVQMSTTGFQFLNYEDLTRSVRKLAAQLATPMAVAGIPRAGELVATMLAEHFAVPKIPLDEALSCNPYLPDQRRAHLRSTNDFVLIVDDTVWGGHAMSYCRSCADPQANLRFACVFSTPENRHLVDYWAEEHPRSLNMFEWNMLREPWAHHAYCDLDGVICSDWNGSESLTPDTYLNHINQARVLYAPTKPIGAVVTGRLECFRPQTEEWLARNHIQFHKLIMYPSADARVRDNDDIGAWKGQFFRDDSNARVFFESDLGQSNRIHDISQKPVVFFPERRLLS